MGDIRLHLESSIKSNLEIGSERFTILNECKNLAIGGDMGKTSTLINGLLAA